MTEYIVLMSAECAASRQMQMVADHLGQAGWREAHCAEGLRIFRPNERALQIIQLGRGVVIGDVFDADGVRASPAAHLPLPARPSLAESAAALTSMIWGRYVAILRVPSGDAGVLRDPSGALDCFSWSAGAIQVIASTLPPALLKVAGPPSLQIDREAIAAFLFEPAALATVSGLKGLCSVAPGAFLALASRQAVQVWRPGDFARRRPLGQEGAAAAMRDAVDLCVRAHASDGRTVIAELSGGLDSAIVASALVRSPATVARWVNFAVEDAAGDERRYAEAVGAHLGVPVTIVKKAVEAARPEALAELQTGLRPSLIGQDEQYEKAMLGACADDGANAIVSGLGGDALFFQMRTPYVLLDGLHRLGRRGLAPARLSGVGRWTRRSAWSLLRMMLTPARARRSGDAFGAPPWLMATTRAAPHPWLQDIGDLPPAKQIHIAALTQMLLSYGASRRGQVVDLVHPLLAQPLLECCLAIPADLLVSGYRDRGLARMAFAGRLPKLVSERRSKGELSAHYARGFALGRNEIVDDLATGRLVAMGLIDPKRLRLAADDAALARDGGQMALLRAASIEAWVRHWDAMRASVEPS